VYAAVIAAKQKDLKYMIGYSSVAHMGVVILGLSTASPLGYTGTVFQMFAHGMVTALLFSCIGYIYETTGTRNMDELGGLAKQFPLIAFAFVMGGLANVGMPGLAGFPAEVQIFFAAIRHKMIFGVIGILGIMFSTIYIFRALQRALFGPMDAKFQQYSDATFALAFPRYLILAFLLFFGFFPQLLVTFIRTATEKM
jgi:NADH-quinone oxidoreductase subunit M